MSTGSNPSHDASEKVTNQVQAGHKGHRITKVGSVTVDQAKGGGTFTVWYCQEDHALLTDTKS